jgi:hypothetical protein
MPAAKANGTLMARGGLDHDHHLMFSQVELGGLEPPTPCLQRRWPRPADLRLHRPGALPVAP